MDDEPRFVLNRSVALLVYKQPFLEWLQSNDPNPDTTLTLEALREDNDIFLIPQFDDLRDSVKWIEKRWRALFDSILFDWLTDESLWPEDRTLAMFRQWFDIHIHSLVWDLSGEPLAVEDWFDEDEGGVGLADDGSDRMLH